MIWVIYLSVKEGGGESGMQKVPKLLPASSRIQQIFKAADILALVF